MATQWYVTIEGEQKGPLTDAELQRWVGQGKVEPDTFVRMGADGEWTAASAFEELFPTQPVFVQQEVDEDGNGLVVGAIALGFVLLLVVIFASTSAPNGLPSLSAGGGAGLIVLLVALAACVFWLVMLVDCLKSQRSDKVVWILLHLFLFVLGAILYLVMAYGKQEEKR